MESNSRTAEITDKSNEVGADEVWKLVAEEGRSARNLLAWNVPIDTTNVTGDGKMKSSPLSPKSPTTRTSSREGSCRPKHETHVKTRIRSASAGRDPKLDLRARYWAFLFENLRRAVDELYSTCEANENIAECKEVIMILENFTKDFSALIEWIKIKNDYENTSPPNRPLSLAWEIRKTSPVKIQPFHDLRSLGRNAVRCLDFGSVSNNNANGKTKLEARSTAKNSALQTNSQPLSDNSVTSLLSKSEVKPSLRNTKSSSTGLKYAHHSSFGDQVTHFCEPGKVETNRKLVNNRQKSNSHLNTGVKHQQLSSSNQIKDLTFTNCQNKPIISTYHASQTASLNSSDFNSKGNDNPRSDSVSSLSSTSSSCRSWADKVKGSSSVGLVIPSEEEGDESDGWEMVQRNKLKPRNSSKSSKFNNKFKNDVQTRTSAANQKDICRSHSDEKLSSTTASSRRHTKEQSCKTKIDDPLLSDTKRSCSYPNFHDIKMQSHTSKNGEPAKNNSIRNKCAKISDVGKTVRKIISNDKKHSSTVALNDKLQPNKHYKNVANEFKIKRKLLVKADASSETDTSLSKNLTSKDEINTVQSLSDEQKQNLQNVPSLKDLANCIIENFPKSKKYYLENYPRMFQAECGNDKQNDLLDDKDFISPAFDDALKSAIQEEKNLTKQLEDSQKSKDSGISVSPDQSEEKDSPELSNSSPTDWHMIHEETEERLAQHLANMTWGDRMDRIEAELRLPGRALHMHEKLSSPSRKRSLSESIRRHEEKQAKAQEQRERLLEEKAQKFREVSKKVEEVRVWKEELLNHRRIMMEHKLQRAEEKRRMQLQMIIKKAHDEEEKVNEIAFINTLEAQNKRHDVLTRIQGFEARLLDLQEERQRKQEEKAAKEAAAEERRRALEAERQARLMEIQEKRKLKEHKIEQQQQEKEKERMEQAREKARDREERLSALHAAQQATVEELQKKIQQKQEESARRHEENIEHIRQKALELSILRYSSTNDDAPKLVPYEKKKICSLCNVLIDSEVYLLSHLRGKKHQQAVKEKHEGNEPSREELEMYNLQHIYDAPADKLDPQLAFEKERQKNLKKRCKKLRQRMTARGSEYEQSIHNTAGESSFKGRIIKCIKDINKYNQQLANDSLPNNFSTLLDRALNEMAKQLEKQDVNDLNLFRINAGYSAIGQLLIKLSAAIQKGISLPKKCFVNACNVYYLACIRSHENCCFVISSNRIGELVDIFMQQLSRFLATEPRHLPSPQWAASTSALARALATVFMGLIGRERADGEPSPERVQDVISYIVSVGVVDKLAAYFNNIRGIIDNEPSVCELIVWSSTLIGSLAQLITHSRKNPFEERDVEQNVDDPTDLVAALQATDLVGTMPLLYGMLLHSGVPARGETPPPQLAPNTLSVIAASLRMLNYIALLDLHLFQSVLGDEGLSLEFRHIASYLLWYCSLRPSHEDLLHELLLSIGYFTVLNSDNQVMIHSGHPPTVLHQLCSLPFQYFSRPHLVNVLFPTLIACCFHSHQNKAIVEQEMSSQLLLNYLQEQESREVSEEDQLTHGTEEEKGLPGRWRLPFRFPHSKWNAARRFFAEPSQNLSPVEGGK